MPLWKAVIVPLKTEGSMPEFPVGHPPVSFSAEAGTAESAVAKDLEDFHKKLLVASPTYKRSVEKATSPKPVIVTVTNEPLHAGASAISQDCNTYHSIAINPYVIFDKRPPRISAN